MWTEAAPWEDWEFSLNGTHRKPLNRQISEFSAIRRAKTQGVALFNGKKIEVKKEVFNSKDEWSAILATGMLLAESPDKKILKSY